MSKETKTGLFIVLLIFVGGIVLAIVDPSGVTRERLWKLVELVDKYPLISVVVLSILLIIIFWVYDRIVNRKFYKAKKEHPNFFEEIRLFLTSILSPFGFHEIGRGGWKDEKAIEFIKDKLSVQLTGDKVYCAVGVVSSDKTETIINEYIGEIERPLYDFYVKGDISEADELKSEVVKKLNEWLVDHDIKQP